MAQVTTDYVLTQDERTRIEAEYSAEAIARVQAEIDQLDAELAKFEQRARRQADLPTAKAAKARKPRAAKAPAGRTLASTYWSHAAAQQLAGNATLEAQEAMFGGRGEPGSQWEWLVDSRIPINTKALLDEEQAEAAGITLDRVETFDKGGEGLHLYRLKGLAMSQVLECDGGLRWLDWLATDGQWTKWDTDSLTWQQGSMKLEDMIARALAEGKYHPSWAIAALEVAQHPVFRNRLRRMMLPYASSRGTAETQGGWIGEFAYAEADVPAVLSKVESRTYQVRRLHVAAVDFTVTSEGTASPPERTYATSVGDFTVTSTGPREQARRTYRVLSAVVVHDEFTVSSNAPRRVVVPAKHVVTRQWVPTPVVGRRVAFAVNACDDRDLAPSDFNAGIPSDIPIGQRVREGHTFIKRAQDQEPLEGEFTRPQTIVTRPGKVKRPDGTVVTWKGGKRLTRQATVAWKEQRAKLRNGKHLRPEDDPLWQGYRNPVSRRFANRHPRLHRKNKGVRQAWDWLSHFIDAFEAIAQTLTVTWAEEVELVGRMDELVAEYTIALDGRTLPTWAAATVDAAYHAASRRCDYVVYGDDDHTDLDADDDYPPLSPALYADLAWVMGTGDRPRHMRPFRQRTPRHSRQPDAVAEALAVASLQDGLTAKQRRILALEHDFQQEPVLLTVVA
jgi:hypothetical protein